MFTSNIPLWKRQLPIDIYIYFILSSIVIQRKKCSMNNLEVCSVRSPIHRISRVDYSDLLIFTPVTFQISWAIQLHIHSTQDEVSCHMSTHPISCETDPTIFSSTHIYFSINNDSFEHRIHSIIYIFCAITFVSHCHIQNEIVLHSKMLKILYIHIHIIYKYDNNWVP